MEDNWNCFVLCCGRQLSMRTSEQYCKLLVGLGLDVTFYVFRVNILCVFGVSLGHFGVTSFCWVGFSFSSSQEIGCEGCL